MREQAIELALELAQRQAARLAAGDFEGYEANVAEYESACRAVSALPAERLRVARMSLVRLIDADSCIERQLAELKDDVARRMASLRRAGRVTETYFATPPSRWVSERRA